MVSNELSIVKYLHCGLCLEDYKNNPEMNKKMSPGDYARTQTGWTREGLQIWCNRHNCNVVHIDFQGHKHPANIVR